MYTYEIYTTDFSMIIQEHNIMLAILKFYERNGYSVDITEIKKVN